MRLEPCTSCEAQIVKAVTPSGPRMPVDPHPVDVGNVELTVVEQVAHARVLKRGEEPVNGRRYVSHFVTCPHADRHRRRKHRPAVVKDSTRPSLDDAPLLL